MYPEQQIVPQPYLAVILRVHPLQCEWAGNPQTTNLAHFPDHPEDYGW
jgi:hypothetical protein